MKSISLPKLGILATASLFFGAYAHAADSHGQSRLDRLVNEVIRPVMAENNVPGMAVAVTVDGRRYFFNYGIGSKESGQKVSEDTIFEVGSK